MKRLLFVISVVCITTIASSQVRNTGSNPTSATGQTKVTNGDVYLHTVKGNYKIYATYVNSKVTGYYALDSNGKRSPARIIAKPDNTSARKLKCLTCVKVIDVETGKSAESCTEMPCPDSITGEKATTKTAQ